MQLSGNMNSRHSFDYVAELVSPGWLNGVALYLGESCGEYFAYKGRTVKLMSPQIKPRIPARKA